MEQQENFYYWPPGSIIPSLSPSTPESGTPEPLSTAPPDTPTTRDKQPPPVRQLLLTESDESFVSVEDALRKILRAQNELKQQMNGIMIRVQNIEQQKTVEVVGSSLSSSSTGASNEKRKRLPSKLSVSIVSCCLPACLYMYITLIGEDWCSLSGIACGEAVQL